MWYCRTWPEYIFNGSKRFIRSQHFCVLTVSRIQTKMARGKLRLRQQPQSLDRQSDTASDRALATGEPGELASAVRSPGCRSQVPRQLHGRLDHEPHVRVYELALHETERRQTESHHSDPLHAGQTSGQVTATRRFPQQPIPESAAQGSRQSHRGVLPRPARIALHPAEAGTRYSC